jgi:hypothetical protein
LYAPAFHDWSEIGPGVRRATLKAAPLAESLPALLPPAQARVATVHKAVEKRALLFMLMSLVVGGERFAGDAPGVGKTLLALG